MKLKTISVYIPDFCPDDCEKFTLDEHKLYADDMRGTCAYRDYSCRNAELCSEIMSILQTGTRPPTFQEMIHLHDKKDE